jgi:osmotically-inducible protein OsmY
LETSTRIKEVRSALEHEPRIELHNHRLEISFEPDDSLILEGELPNIAAKKLALRHAAAVPGVLAIVDRLRVTPSRRMGDGEIRDHVRNAFAEEPVLDQCGIRTEQSGHWQVFRQARATPRCSIDLAVEDGVVTLNGQVTSLSQKRLAGVLAWWVPGSCDVINGLEVVPVQRDSDDEITEAVKLVLEKDPLINASRVRIRTRDAAVMLEGLVANESEKEMAEADAWYVIGVDRVDNRLECEH